MSVPRAEILTVGTELLLHGQRDTNSAELCDLLTGLGFQVDRRVAVADDLEPLTDAIRGAADRASLVVSTGGLGPTGDDRTREGLARAFGRSLRLDPALLDQLEARFRSWGREMPRSNRRQALMPDGAEALPNREGTAPGLWLEAGAGVVLALPGPPAEMRSVLDGRIQERLRERFRPPAVARRVILTSGLAESALEDRIGEVYARERRAQLTILASPGQVVLRILARDPDPRRAERAAERLARTLASRLGEAVVATEEATLAAVVGERLRATGRTLSVAESCTGGMLGEELTRNPGSSDFFLGGVVAYGDRAKEALLGVPPETLQARGAVSEETARAMAEGARDRFGSDYALSITGIAGPGGGRPDKPVGTICLAVAAAEGTVSRRRVLPGGRNRVRRWAVAAVLDLLLRRLDGSAVGTRP